MEIPADFSVPKFKLKKKAIVLSFQLHLIVSHETVAVLSEIMTALESE